MTGCGSEKTRFGWGGVLVAISLAVQNIAGCARIARRHDNNPIVMFYRLLVDYCLL